MWLSDCRNLKVVGGDEEVSRQVKMFYSAQRIYIAPYTTLYLLCMRKSYLKLINAFSDFQRKN